MSKPIPSATYKLRAPTITDHAIYFTVVGEGKPIAFFLNSKSMESFALVTGLMTSYHRYINDGGDIKNIIADMKENFDPKGKYIIPKKSKCVNFPVDVPREAHGLIHHLGLILEYHVNHHQALSD